MVFVLIAILIAGTLAIFTLSAKKSQAATIEMDQLNYPPYYTNPPGYKSYIVKHVDVYVPCQKFKPGKSIMASYLDLPLGYGFGEAASALIHEATGAYGNEPGNEIVTYTANVSTEFEVGQWQRFNASGETTVNTSNYYWLCLGTNNINLRWYYSEPSGYNNGFLLLKYRNGVPVFQANQDFGFRTFGYDPDQPAGPSDDQPVDQGGTTGTTSTTSSGEILGTPTTTIAKPLELTAAYSEADHGVKLAWKASTTADIDGYKIFRSENKDKGYTKIKDTKKDKLDYLDQDIAVGKTYYYQVRAYKGSGQSYSSNTATAAIPADAPPAKPQKLTIVSTTTDTISVKWQANSETNLAGYTISLFKGEEKVKSEELKKDATTYQFNNTEAGTSYIVELIAKNDAGKSSAPATALAETTAKATTYSLITPLTITLFSAAVILTGVLIFMMIKRQRKLRS